jgi:pimeloyl-ACP methyl ester carboxylesterase
VDYREHDFRQHTVAMLQQLWSALGLGATPVLGSSLGGMSALWLAVADPNLVSKLVILGVPAIALRGAKLDLALRLLTIPGLNRLLLSLPSSPENSRRLSKGAFGPGALARTPREAFEIHHLAGRRPEFGTTLTTMLQTATRWFSPLPRVVLTDSEIAGLHQPVRFIWGDRDIYGGSEVGNRAAGLMQDAALAVHPGGHFPQLDDPERCGKLVSEFLSVTSSPN